MSDQEKKLKSLKNEISGKISESNEEFDKNEVLKNLEKEKDNLKDIKGSKQVGKIVVSNRTGKEYHVIPVALDQVPDLVELITNLETVLNSDGNPILSLSKKDEDGNNAVLEVMCKIMSMGLKEEMTQAEIAKNFSLGDFPKIYRIVLDLNDFLSGMKTAYQR